MDTDFYFFSLYTAMDTKQQFQSPLDTHLQLEEKNFNKQSLDSIVEQHLDSVFLFFGVARD